MSEIKPIQTYYDGHWFRSRLEARWAVFFNSGLIKYDYEPEGFTLSDGTCYLPDFYLPDYDIYVEVKRDTEDGIADVENKCEKIIQWGGPIKKLLVLSNVPEGKSPDGGIWHFPIRYWHAGEAAWGWAFFCDAYDNTVMVSIPQDLRSDWYLWRSKKRRTLGPVTDIAFRRKKLDTSELPIEGHIEIQEDMNSLTFKSYRVARNARFEYGETPPDAAEFAKIRKEEAEIQALQNTFGRQNVDVVTGSF